MRLFFATAITENIKELVGETLGKSRIDKPPWKWIPRENYHITLKFLGEVEENKLDVIKEASREIASNAGPPFELVFGGFGAFPSISSPRVLFYSVRKGGERLLELASGIDTGMQALGFKREKRKFHAHLTLARVKKRLPPAIIEKLESIPPLPVEAMQQVDSFCLMRSHLSPKGAEYEKLAEFRI